MHPILFIKQITKEDFQVMMADIYTEYCRQTNCSTAVQARRFGNMTSLMKMFDKQNLHNCLALLNKYYRHKVNDFGTNTDNFSMIYFSPYSCPIILSKDHILHHYRYLFMNSNHMKYIPKDLIF